MHESTEPTEPGFYYGEGARGVMVHLLDATGQWWTCFDNAAVFLCEWGYIEQSTAAYPLRRLDPSTTNAA